MSTKPHIEYCLGFAFYGTDVVLIRKERPDFQKGLLNGVGGKIEIGETPIQSMSREFLEETKVFTFDNQWKYFGHLNDTALINVKVHVFYAELTLEQFQYITANCFNLHFDEPIRVVNIYDELNFLNILGKLMYNIPDIVIELSNLLYGNNSYHQFKRHISTGSNFAERINRCTL